MPGSDSASTQTSSSSTVQPWEPVHLSEAHRFMIEQHVRGVPLRRIQTTLKRYGQPYSGGHIKKVFASRSGQQYASLVSAQIFGGIPALVEAGAQYLPLAINTQVDIMKNPLEGSRHRLQAAEDHLSRFGIPLATREERQNNTTPLTIVVHLSPEQLRQFQNPPPTIEAEAVELLPEQSSADDEPVVGTIAPLSRRY